MNRIADELIAARDALSPDYRAAAAEAIAGRLTALPSFAPSAPVPADVPPPPPLMLPYSSTVTGTDLPL